MYNGLQAYDTGTGKPLSNEQAQDAADNPRIWKWVEWR
jgi:hypothetical protein